jgi:hypothetical protein
VTDSGSDEAAEEDLAFDELRRFITECRDLIDTLDRERDPNPGDVDKARMTIRHIRVGLQRGDPVRQIIMDLRDQLVAVVYAKAPKVGVQELADDAGFGSSYVSRVAHRKGIPPRTVRPGRTDVSPGAEV